MSRRLIHPRLHVLLTLMEVSGALAYRRQLGLAELPRRIMTLIGGYGGLTSIELVGLTGAEKAQVSRAVKALGEVGLVARASLRAPVELSAAGEREFERIMAVGRSRNTALLQGIDAADVARFRTATLRLIDQAALMLAEERQAGEPIAEPPHFPDRVRAPDPDRALTQMVVPPLITLAAYLERGATIVYRRETGLTNFGWRVLDQIGEHEPVTLARLIALIGNDKSQVGRGVRRLEEAGIVLRAPVRGRRDIMLCTTPDGRRTYQHLRDVALRRDEQLSTVLRRGERGRYLAVLDALTVNAESLLAAERHAQQR